MNFAIPVRYMLAAALVLQPLLLGINAAFHPSIEFTAEGILGGAAESANRWYVVHLVAALGALLTIPTVIGLRSLVRERGRRVANVGVGAGIVAATLLSVAFGIEGSVLRLILVSDIDDGARMAIVESLLSAPETIAIPVGVLAFALAGLLVATSLIMARAVPRWQAALYMVGLVGTLAGAPGSPIGPLAFAMITLAAIFLAGHVVRGPQDHNQHSGQRDSLAELSHR